MTNCSFQTKHGKVSFRAKKCNGTRTQAPAKKVKAAPKSLGYHIRGSVSSAL